MEFAHVQQNHKPTTESSRHWLHLLDNKFSTEQNVEL